MPRKPSHSFHDDEFERLFSDEFLLNNQQAALYLQVSESTLNHWRSDGRGPAFVKLLGSTRGAIRYRIVDLREWVAGRVITSTANAEYLDAAARVSSSTEDWSHMHPFVVRTGYFVVDSAYASTELFISIFFDPFVKLRWMRPDKAIEMPWVAAGRRQVLLGKYLNTKQGTKSRAKLLTAYDKNLRRVPERLYGSNPDLTLPELADRVGRHYPVEFYQTQD